MWISSKLDEADFGPSDWSPDIVAWTPKQKNDSVKKAGYRLFWAASLAMDNVGNEELYSGEFAMDGIIHKLVKVFYNLFLLYRKILFDRESCPYLIPLFSSLAFTSTMISLMWVDLRYLPATTMTASRKGTRLRSTFGCNHILILVTLIQYFV
jgi:hypothetical protein